MDVEKPGADRVEPAAVASPEARSGRTDLIAAAAEVVAARGGPPGFLRDPFGRVAPDAFRRWVDLALDALRAPEAAREPLRARPLRGDQIRRALAERQQPTTRQKA